MIQSKSTPEFLTVGSRDSTPPSTPADLASPYPSYLTTSPHPQPNPPSRSPVPTLHTTPSSPRPSSPPHPSLSSSVELRLPFRSPDTSPTHLPSPNPSPLPPLSRTVPWRKKLVLCLVGLPARGKCWVAGTTLRMYDGGVIKVEDVQGGEVLMGDDGLPRTVTPGSITTGRATLYDVVGKRASGGSSMTVNEDHILVLINSNRPHLVRADMRRGDKVYSSWKVKWYEVNSNNDMKQLSRRFNNLPDCEAELNRRRRGWRPLEWEVSVRQYLATPAWVRRRVSLFRSGPVTFHNPQHVSLEQHLTNILSVVPSSAQLSWAAWYLGMWLTDGVANTDWISQGGPPRGEAGSHWEAMDRVLEYTQLFNEAVTQALDRQSSAGNDAHFFKFGQVGLRGAAAVASPSIVHRLLNAYNLLRNKHVPAAWMFESIEVRQRIMAGVIDGDGHLRRAGEDGWNETCYEIACKSGQILQDLRTLLLSLGIRASFPIAKNLVLPDGQPWRGWRMHFSGHVAEVTQFCELTYKRCDQPDDDTRSFPFNVTVSNRGRYHGFSVHGGANSRLLLEDFTVTHNVSSHTFRSARDLPCHQLSDSMMRSHVKQSQDATFFDANNTTAQQQRDALALEVLESMLDWLEEGGDVSVFDATNTTNKRRWEVFRHCQRRSSVLRVIFVESICDDPKVLESNYMQKAKNSPDYKDMDVTTALADLRLRISNYEKVYEPIQDDALSYLKLINLNSKVIANKIHGSLGHLISAYLMSIHIQPRPIYLVRTGKCEGEERIPLSQRISDIGSKDEPFHMPFTINMAANLTERGKEFSKRLAAFLSERAMTYFNTIRSTENLDPLMNTLTSLAVQLGVGREVEEEETRGGYDPNNFRRQDEREKAGKEESEQRDSILSPSSMNRSISRVDLPLIVYTSTLPRAQQTVSHLVTHALLCEQTSALNMMDTGILHGLSVEEIRQRHPEELERWHQQRYTYRFPGGESQADKARSLESLVMEIERHFFPVLIVSHASTLQVLYGYFLGSSKSVNDYYSLHVPQHFVIELTPNQYGWEEKRWDLRSEEEKAEDLEMRKERLKRMQREAKEQGISNGTGPGGVGYDRGIAGVSPEVQRVMLSADSRRGSDRFIAAAVNDLNDELKSRPRIGTLHGQQPDVVTHNVQFYQEG